MNQILVNQKVYLTPKLVRKKRFYKIQFIISILVVIILISYYVYSDVDKRKSEAESQEILNNIFSDFSEDDSLPEEEILVVALNENTEPIEEVTDTDAINDNRQVLDKFNTIYKTSKGTQYRVDSILNIPSLEIRYPVISECTTELLKISLNKFWGREPNEIGNYCIVGHNYDGKDIFFGKLHKLQNGDIVELQDKTGRTLKYEVYNKFIVVPKDTDCTSQRTNGKREMTLITCSDGGKTRLIVKCREIES